MLPPEERVRWLPWQSIEGGKVRQERASHGEGAVARTGETA